VREYPEEDETEHDEVDPRTRGKILHEFLENVADHGHDKAVAMAPEEWRDQCAAMSLDGLEDVLRGCTPEVAFAYDVVTDTARELGRGEDRDYDSVTETEIPCQLDLVGVAPDRSRGLVLDHKTGFSRRSRAGRNAQLKFGALCVARTYQLDRVDVQLAYVDPGRTRPYIVPAAFDALDLDAFAAEIRARHAEAMEMRAAAARGVIPSDLAVGPWCRWCPALRVCPAQTSYLRATVGLDWLDEVIRQVPMPLEVAGDARNRIQAAKKVIAVAERMVMAAARGGPPLPLGKDADGLYRWFGMVLKPGDRELDAEVARAVLREAYPPDHLTARDMVRAVLTEKKIVDPDIVFLDDVDVDAVIAAATTRSVDETDAADEASIFEVSIGRLEKAVRKRAPKRGGAKAIAAVMETIEKRGGLKRTAKLAPMEFSTKDGNPGPAPSLPAAAPPALPSATEAEKEPG
jgi:hypothetical protein